MSSKFLILVTCSSFLRAFAEKYFMVPPNHRLNDESPFNLYYYLPMMMNDQPKKYYPMNNMMMNNMKMRRLPAQHMMPPIPHAASNYNDYHGLPMSEMDDKVPYNHRPYPSNYKKNPKKVRDERPTYTREHDPFITTHSGEIGNLKSQEYKVKRKKKSKKRPTESLELSPDGDRVEFQIQGHEGPATYIFGYDTGDGKNRQFRLEERLSDGSIKGHYGYYDARGKLRTVRYSALPAGGYTEKHHESNEASMEEEYSNKKNESKE